MMSISTIFTSIKTWFVGASVGTKVAVVVAGIVVATGAIATPILIINSNNNRQAEVSHGDQDQPTSDNDVASNDDGNTEKSPEANTEETEGETQTDDNKEKPTNTSGQVGQTGQSGQGQNTSDSNPSKPANSTPTKPTQQTQPSTQPNTPTKTEADLRNERDQKRREDMAKVKTGVIQFQTNNNGKLPITSGSADGTGDYAWQPSQNDVLPPRETTNIMAKFIRNYLNAANATKNAFKDPDGWTYGMFGFKYDNYINFSNKSQHHTVYLISQAKCGIATSVLRTENTRDFAVVYKLENGNNYCLDNQ